jgi:hypothetical protein
LKNQTTDLGNQDTLKYFIIWVVTLLSIKFYTLFVSYSAGKGLVLFGGIIVIFIYLLNAVYNKNKDILKRFSLPVVLIFISLLISTFAANYFHNQPFISTLLSQFDFYLFLFYFVLHKLKPKLEKLLDMIIIVGQIYCLIYFAQYIIYPKLILSCGILTDRGTVRIFMPGIAYMVSAFYIILSRYFITNKPKLLFQLIPILVVLFLLGTRQTLGIVLLMTILMILFSKKVKSKFLIFLLITISILPIFFIFQDIIYNMFDVSKTQSSQGSGYVRLRAAQYYLLNFNPRKLWMLVGNGMPAAHTNYGTAIDRITLSTGFYLNDIGLIGDFFRFGIIYVLVILFVQIKMGVMKLDEKYSYIRYMAFTDLLALITGSGLQSQFIVFMCISMYILDVNRKEIEMRKINSVNQATESKIELDLLKKSNIKVSSN